MTATTPSPQPEWLALGGGQMGLHWLTAGTTLIALEGGLRLEPPARWIAGTQYTLSAGHVYVLETSGWWRLHADARNGAYVRLVTLAGGGSAGSGQHARPSIWRWLVNAIQPRQTSRG